MIVFGLERQSPKLEDREDENAHVETESLIDESRGGELERVARWIRNNRCQDSSG